MISMRTYLVDATNATRRDAYAPGFPEQEDADARRFVERLSSLASALGGRVAIELVFDGPRRDLGYGAGLTLRFSGERSADDLILGTVRSIRAQGRGVIVATEDSGLADEVEHEGGRAIGFGELMSRLRSGKA